MSRIRKHYLHFKLHRIADIPKSVKVKHRRSMRAALKQALQKTIQEES